MSERRDASSHHFGVRLRVGARKTGLRKEAQHGGPMGLVLCAERRARDSGRGLEGEGVRSKLCAWPADHARATISPAMMSPPPTRCEEQPLGGARSRHDPHCLLARAARVGGGESASERPRPPRRDDLLPPSEGLAFEHAPLRPQVPYFGIFLATSRCPTA